ncbi:hypothetical protein SAMN06893096_103251 [Geodermatophilus pulveris]|uniref:Uncharacterized protein n=1 Tax=Geodermatophilus pulveris TaxID=1564159 RepID=A0A239DMN5_9ACTN|nr:hypothetical protein [Geodermatophilus pulveris]SNS33108.1 hypothetical protein SAMN06893096_103251 [Geodermatophilus pulveris]
MSLENRLTAAQLAALTPGDTVTIESAPDVRGTRWAVGTVIRVGAAEIVVKSRGRRGTFVERYGRRDGIRRSGSPAELVNAEPTEPATAEQRREAQRIHSLYRAWSRNRADVDTLRQLHAAIGDYLLTRTG